MFQSWLPILTWTSEYSLKFDTVSVSIISKSRICLVVILHMYVVSEFKVFRIHDVALNKTHFWWLCVIRFSNDWQLQNGIQAYFQLTCLHPQRKSEMSVFHFYAPYQLHYIAHILKSDYSFKAKAIFQFWFVLKYSKWLIYLSQKDSVPLSSVMLNEI